MSFLCKLFYKKPPDGLLEISERVYVFDCCFASDTWEAQEYKDYVGGVITQLADHYPEASILVFNFHEEGAPSQIANALAEYDLTIMDYPRHYESCPVLQMEVIHRFLQSSENWLSQGQQNVLLMHCEWGGWPVLAFMLAALLIYTKQYYGEQKTLDMVYKQAPHELLHSISSTNPMPSQIRYLQYVSRRNVVPEWPPPDRALALDCIIIRMIPDFDGKGGCRPIFRIYAQEPFKVSDQNPKLLFSTPRQGKALRHYKQAECDVAKIDINCHIQGDVVLECMNLHDDMEQEQMILRVMFNTAFIRSNIIMLDWNDIDMLWDAKDQFARDFRAEVIFSEMDAAASRVPIDLSCFEEKDGLPMEAFAKVQEIFNNVDWLSPKNDAALDMIQQITGSTINAREKLDAGPDKTADPSSLLLKLAEKHQDEQQSPKPLDNKNQSETSHGTAQVQNTSENMAKPKSTEFKSEGTSPSQHSQPSSRVASTESSPSLHAPSSPEKSQHRSTSEDIGPSSTELPDANKYERSENAPSAVSKSRQPPKEEFASKTKSPPPPAVDIGHSPDSPPSTTPHVPQTTPLKDGSPGSVKSAHPHPQHTDAAFQSSKDTKDTKNDQPQAPTSPAIPSDTHASPVVPGKDQDIKNEPSSPPDPASAKDQNVKFGGAPPPSSPSTSPSKEDSPPKGKPPPPPAPNLSSHAPPAPPSAVAPLQPPPAGAECQQGPPPPPPPGASNQQGPPPPPPPGAENQQGPPPPPPPGAANQQGPPPPPPPGAANQQGPPPPPPPGAANQQGPPPPPPPGAGNPQAPIPPPSGPPCMGRGGLLSRTMNRTNKLKPLHWLKLTRAVQGSLWDETQRSADASKAPDIDIPELESLFSAAVPKSGKGGPGSKTNSRTPAVNKPEKVQLIDHKRAYNCEIMLSKVKIPLNELMNSVLALEDSAIDADQLDNLIKFCPTKEEMELLKNYKAEKDKLGKCEQFFLELMKVPRAESKLRVFSFKLQFGSQVSDLRNSLDVVNSTAEQIRSSSKLKKIMQTILSLGNALNQGTARGSAVGFKLETLPKLAETRARNNKMTLMHYLCKVLDEKLPEVLDFSKDLGSLESSSKIQVKALAEEMQAINKGLEKVVQELSLSENDGPVSEKFHKVSREFLCIAEGELRSLASLYSVVLSQLYLTL
ncbi:formin-like protein 13 isoform X2 [Daucus carota subsp. sativus]|uniref:formin-like protein 13 isoform X2 n=1 Tax=Daucus carota subsp. sativus TaxID=79200 RepID=UPI003083CC5C